MDKINSYNVNFTGGTIKVKSSIKHHAPKEIKDAIILTAEEIAEIADKNGVNVTYSMRSNPSRRVLLDDITKTLFIHVNRSNGIFKRIFAGSLRGYGEYRNPLIAGNFDRQAFVANVREIVSRYKTKFYEGINEQVRKSVL